MTKQKPLLGISQCLTDCIVRYDGQPEYKPELIDRLQKHFDLLTVCPEVECGLAVPRPPVELVELKNNIYVIGRDNKQLDITDKLKNYSASKVQSLSELSGYIFKSRSPSCGLGSTTVFNARGEYVRLSNGIFADRLVTTYPMLPVIEDTELENQKILDEFIGKVKSYFTNALQG